MPAVATLRRQIEETLETRFPAALSPSARTLRECAATGISQVDRLLDGGFPVGAISELTGPESSGRTSLALTFLAQRTAEESFCAWVDAHDTLDPHSAAASGVDLKRLLWVRCRDNTSGTRDNIPGSRKHEVKLDNKPWTRLDQALRATDLLLQAGGFASIVLDLGNVAPEHGMRIPLASWFRFRQAADRSRCSLLILSRAAYAQSSAALALECAPLRLQTAGGRVLEGFTYELRRGRQRFAQAWPSAKKPPASTWSAGTAWQAEKRA